MADPHHPSPRPGRRGRIEACVFATFAALHVPGAVVAVAHPTTSGTAALVAATSVLASCLLWVALTAAALHALGRGRRVPRGLLAVALSLDAVVLTISGLSPPRPGNTTAASVGILAVCAAAALLTRPRLLPLVLTPAVVGQAVLLRAADASASSAQLVADVVTVTAASLATALLIAWLEHERRRARAALAAAAGTDPLTGLLNRRGMDRGLPGLWEEPPTSGPSRRRPGGSGTPRTGPAGEVVVVVLDIDRFKGVNDRHGHDVGDAVLVAVAGALRDSSRSGDLQVRLGGEELAWIARWPDPRAAVTAVERLRALVADRTRALGAPVTLSAGVATAPGVTRGTRSPSPVEAAEALAVTLTLADRALYRAKEGGRDRVELAPDEGASRTPAPA